MKKFLKIIGILLIVVILAGTGFYFYINSAFPKVSPAPNMKVEITPERVQKGDYLVHHVVGCLSCHSERDFKKFAGPVIAGSEGKGGEAFDENLGFPGNFYAKNITPAGIGNWTDGELFRAITAGVNKDGKALFPIMPYLHFGKMDEEDINCIIAYIRTLKPIQNEDKVSVPKFPMTLIIKTIPEDGHLTKKPDKSNILEYGKYLVNAGSCIECHSQATKGKIKEGFEYAGGFEFPLGNGYLVRSANITPDNETGIGLWTKEQFVTKFKSYSTPESRNITVKDGEFNSFMPWTDFAGQDKEDLEAIYTYLRTLPAVKNKVEKFSLMGVRN